ncbi:short-chain dehydrogenase/reductase family 16C member 6-like isoform X2 [Mauremys reevesii]|uniref:short-chain dehydrogenase/reductase family 16C member 6-like isoform X2 n=1 Tax=Mauremys reevesii TaxID=260615 RepID=UPI00193F9D5C|nr:short-chain dehydrogenase/reductase family 16C member 6-like isoform X2 [Mauremys reevesii]
MCKLSSISETLKFLILLGYYYFEAFILFICPPCKKNVAGEIVLITGAANGIGRQIALNFARLGATLVFWDIDEEGNKETIKLAKENGAKGVYAYKCDCSNREEVYRVADQVRKEVGDVNILVNDAGIANVKTFLDLPDADMEKTIRVNIMAQFWTCKAFLPAMIACNRGHLVSISSGTGLIGANKLTDYSASKFAIIGFLESLAFELQAAGKKGIKTTIVCPSFVNTELSRGIRVSFVPKKVLFLAVEYAGIFNNLDGVRDRKRRDQNHTAPKMSDPS